jgi:hypothetical protein
MKRHLLMLFACAGLCGKASAIVVSGTNVAILDPQPINSNSSFDAQIQQVPDPKGDYTDVIFSYTGNKLGITFADYDEESDWYLAQAGDSFSASTIAANRFTPVYFTEPNENVYLPPVSIPQGNFFLAINTGKGFPYGGPTFRNVFGWAEFNNTGAQLSLVDSAMAYGEQGIFIGSINPVPEPGLFPGFAFGALLLVGRPRRRHHPLVGDAIAARTNATINGCGRALSFSALRSG